MLERVSIDKPASIFSASTLCLLVECLLGSLDDGGGQTRVEQVEKP
jgi:hypothetical protein